MEDLVEAIAGGGVSGDGHYDVPWREVEGGGH
jgi:hypothetical protein